MARLLREAKNIEDFKNVGFESLIDLCEKANRLVDIMNSRGKDHDAPIIDSPTHELLIEALDILIWFRQWKQEIDDDPTCDSEWDFFNTEISSDLNLMIFSLVCTCRFYLSKFSKFKPAIVQRRGNQDPCEHCFAHIRSHCGGTQHATSQMAASATSTASADRHACGGNTKRNCTTAALDGDHATPLNKRNKNHATPLIKRKKNVTFSV